jgi:hypothetical protein
MRTVAVDLFDPLPSPEEITSRRAAELEFSKVRFREIAQRLKPDPIDCKYPALRKEAMLLRRQGFKIVAIAAKLGVAQSSVSKWARHSQ